MLRVRQLGVEVGRSPTARADEAEAHRWKSSSSHVTRSWREPDSNHRSRCCKRLCWALPIRTSARSVEPPKVRSEIARIDLGGPPMAVPFAGGPIDAMGRAARDGNFVAACNRWSAAMPQPNDLSRSLVALD